MSTLTTTRLSAAMRKTGGVLLANAANFPCCKLFFPFSETSGNVFTDVINANNYTAPSTGNQPTFATPNAVTFTVNTYTNQALGTPIAIGAKSALMLLVGNLGAISIYLRLSSGSTRYIIDAGAACVISDGTNTATMAAAAQGSIVGEGVLYTPGVSGEGKHINATLAAYTADLAVNGSLGSITTMPTLTNFQISNPSNTSDIYGLAFFVFNSTPSADLIRMAISEMTRDWQAGNKWLPSSLYGIL